MKEQENIINKTMIEWMEHIKNDGKPHSQIDDMLIMGMRF